MRALSSGSRPLIVPRFQLSDWKPEDFSAIIPETPESKDAVREIKVLSKSILTMLDELGVDGVVLEVAGVPLKFLWHLVRYLGRQLHAAGRKLILVLAPSTVYQGDERANSSGLELEQAFGASVDRYSLMTYDYSTFAGRIGPNAPLDWVRSELNLLCPAINVCLFYRMCI
jgi:chitinase domain-containing protein 1